MTTETQPPTLADLIARRDAVRNKPLPMNLKVIEECIYDEGIAVVQAERRRVVGMLETLADVMDMGARVATGHACGDDTAWFVGIATEKAKSEDAKWLRALIVELQKGVMKGRSYD